MHRHAGRQWAFRLPCCFAFASVSTSVLRESLIYFPVWLALAGWFGDCFKRIKISLRRSGAGVKGGS